MNDKKEESQDLTALAKDAVDLKLEIEALEKDTKAKKEVYNRLSAEILRTLELMEIDSLKAHGFLFFKENRSSVSVPKDPEAKQELFEFLESQDMFMEMVSVNSMTLNALYKNLAAEALEQGNLDFRLPGVAEPKVYTNLKLRRSK